LILDYLTKNFWNKLSFKTSIPNIDGLINRPRIKSSKIPATRKAIRLNQHPIRDFLQYNNLINILKNLPFNKSLKPRALFKKNLFKKAIKIGIWFLYLPCFTHISIQFPPFDIPYNLYNRETLWSNTEKSGEEMYLQKM